MGAADAIGVTGPLTRGTLDGHDGRPAVQVLVQALAVGGVVAAYGRPMPGLPMTEVADPQVALLLAHAHRAVHGVPAVAHIGDGPDRRRRRSTRPRRPVAGGRTRPRRCSLPTQRG